MIPGVVAGFPRPAVAQTITLDSGYWRYVAYNDVSAPGVIGSTSPAYLSTVPNAGSTPGVNGELLSLQIASGSPGQTGDLLIYIRGYPAPANVPFTTMTLNGVSYPRSGLSGSAGSFLAWGGVRLPPVGRPISIVFT